MSVKSVLDRIFNRKQYFYVPPCPRCGSVQTGYVLENIGTINIDIEVEKIKRLLNGELVELHNYVSNESTLFCNECGIEWHGRPEVRYLTEEEIENQKTMRGIDDEYVYLRNNTAKGQALMRSYIKDKVKQKKKEKKRQKKEGAIKVKKDIKNKNSKQNIKVKVKK